MIFEAFAVLNTEQERNDIAEFYKKNKNRLFHIAYSKLHNENEAEDAVMETFSKIADNPVCFFQIKPDKRQAYAGVIAKNIACEMLRRKNKFSADNLDEYLDSVYSDISLEDIFFDKERTKELTAFIYSMSDTMKDTLILKAVHKKSNAEIAKILNITEEVVRARLSRAKKQINEFLERRDHE